MRVVCRTLSPYVAAVVVCNFLFLLSIKLRTALQGEHAYLRSPDVLAPGVCNLQCAAGHSPTRHTVCVEPCTHGARPLSPSPKPSHIHRSLINSSLNHRIHPHITHTMSLILIMLTTDQRINLASCDICIRKQNKHFECLRAIPQ